MDAVLILDQWFHENRTPRRVASRSAVGALASLIALASPALAQSDKPAQPEAPAQHFTGVDLFGTRRFTIEQVREKLGAELTSFEADWLAQQYERAAFAKEKLTAAVKQLGGFAFAEFSVIQYYGEGRPTYLTIDVVEPEDVARRMTFGPEPTESFPDPGGLLAIQEKYEAAGWELLKAGEPIRDEAAQKETFHCVFGFAHPRLAPFKAPLLEGAERHADELVAMLHRDRDPAHRAGAAFLLAFTKDGARVVQELAPACKDASSHVRNNALRVFAETARHHPELELPLHVVLDALEYPTTTDRNKASAILEPLTRKPELREAILRRPVPTLPTLLAMLALQQPNNHDFAWTILKNLSGEEFGERDLAAWTRWVDEELRAEK